MVGVIHALRHHFIRIRKTLDIEEKTPKNRSTETLEPHKQHIGAPKLVSRYQIHSLSTLQLSGCCQLTLEAETK